jgi:hypothetical protein
LRYGALGGIRYEFDEKRTVWIINNRDLHSEGSRGSKSR